LEVVVFKSVVLENNKNLIKQTGEEWNIGR